LVKTALARGAHEHVETMPLYNPEKPGIEQVRWQWRGLCCGWAWFKDLTGLSMHHQSLLSNKNNSVHAMRRKILDTV